MRSFMGFWVAISGFFMGAFDFLRSSKRGKKGSKEYHSGYRSKPKGTHGWRHQSQKGCFGQSAGEKAYRQW